jgi:PAS domain S-box-containing protein
VQQQATDARKDDGGSDRVSPPLKRITTAWRWLPGARGGIGFRLLVRVLLFSAVMTLLLTLAQLYVDYRRDVGAIDQRMSEIDSGYRQSLSEGLWRLDARQLRLQTEGILRLPDISYVELREATNRAAPLVVVAGSRQANPATRREFRIYYTNHGAEQLVGILVVEATFDRIYRRLFRTATVILVGQAIMTFIVSFFILLIVHQLITRHLTAIATSISGYDLRGSQAPLRLDRRRPVDELDRLVDAFNDMYAGLQAAYRDLAEREKQQTAIAEMLRVISSSPIESVLEAIVANAARLSDANNTEIFRLEGNLLRLVASYGEIPVVIHAYQGVLLNRDTVTGRAACDRRTIQVHDLAAEEDEYPAGSRNAKREGHHTTLGTPLLREGIPIGVILVRRREVRPFSDKQIALIETFADQVVVAIENARLFEAEKQRTLALARANRDLAEREARIRRLVDSNIMGVFIWDFDGRILDANDEFLHMVRYDREDLVAGRIKWTDLTPPDWRDRTNAKMDLQKSSGRFEPFEKEYARKDGSRFPLMVGGATFEPGGEQGVAFVVDLTERKRADTALRESELKLREIIETVPAMLWSTGPDGEPTHVSQRVLDYAGMRFEDFLNLGWKEFLHPEDVPETEKAFYHAIQTGEPYEAVHRLRRADGQYRWHHARGEPLRDKEQRIIHWFGLTVDIHERKTAEDRLRRSEAYLAEAERLSQSGSAAYNQTELLYLSEEAYRMFGFDPLLGIPSRDAMWQRIHPDDLGRTNEIIERAVDKKRSFANEFRILRPDGTILHIEAINHPVFSEDGELIEIVVTGLDVSERKRAEEALRESEYKLRQITETVPGHLWSSADLDVEATYMNQHLLDYFGRPFGDFEGGGWKAFLHPDDLAVTEEALSHAVQTRTSFEVIHRLRRADGEFRWHHTRGAPLRDRDGRIVQWYGLSIDVDEAKNAEDRLRRSEAYLAEAQRLSHTGTSVFNPTTVLYWSDETYRIFGFDQGKRPPSRVAALQAIHPDDRERAQEEARRGVGEKRDYKLQFRLLLPTGIKFIEAIAHPKFSESGEVTEVVSTIIDVTDRKRAEDAVRASEAKFRDYAETASDWFWETDPDYRFTLLTENAFGSDPAQRIGRMCWDYALDVATEPGKWRQVWAALDARESFRDFIYCTSDGSGATMYVKASGKPVFDNSGNFCGYRGTGTDVTAIVRGQRAEASLQTVQAELAHVGRVMTLGQLTASIAHEVNQPIGSARNNARAALNFLDRSAPDLGEVREALGCIVADADRAGGIIDRIRDQIKKVPPRSDPFDLNRAIEEVIGLAQSMMTESEVLVQSRLANGMAHVLGDRVQLQQVVLNLILNAVEAMRSVDADERRLLISTDQSEANGTLVAVRDSGPGIDPKNHEQIFEAFYSTKSGMGMGLSICRSIIAAHGGQLWATAAEPKGALFQFTLPQRKVVNRQSIHDARERH